MGFFYELLFRQYILLFVWKLRKNNTPKHIISDLKAWLPGEGKAGKVTEK